MFLNFRSVNDDNQTTAQILLKHHTFSDFRSPENRDNKPSTLTSKYNI